jgi:hypothetical protein
MKKNYMNISDDSFQLRNKLIFFENFPHEHNYENPAPLTVLISGLLKSRGYTLSTPDKSDILVFFDLDRKKFHKYKKYLNSDAKKILIRSEPASVLPFQFSSKNLAVIDNIISLGATTSLKNGNETRFPWPIKDTFFNHKNYSLKSSSQGTSILVSNKFSFHKNSNYYLRSELISSHKSLEVAGKDWGGISTSLLRQRFGSIADIPDLIKLKALKFSMPEFVRSLNFKPNIYHGSISNKLEFLQRFRCSLVIENENSYLSEKLLESVLSGVPTIYVGPEIDGHLIPRDVYLTAKPNLPNIDSLIQLIELDFSLAKRLSDKSIAWKSLESTRDLFHEKYVWKNVINYILDFCEN